MVPRWNQSLSGTFKRYCAKWKLLITCMVSLVLFYPFTLEKQTIKTRFSLCQLVESGKGFKRADFAQ